MKTDLDGEFEDMALRHPHLDVSGLEYKPPMVPGFKLITLRAKRDAPKGSGTRFMEELCAWADRKGILLFLQTAARDKPSERSIWYKWTTSEARLKRFYKRFGFVSNYGKRSYRLDITGNMHRHPK